MEFFGYSVGALIRRVVALKKSFVDLLIGPPFDAKVLGERVNDRSPCEPSNSVVWLVKSRGPHTDR